MRTRITKLAKTPQNDWPDVGGLQVAIHSQLPPF